MKPEQQKSILAIAQLAAFADDVKHDRERHEIRRVAESIKNESGVPDLARLYQDLLLKPETMQAASAVQADPGERQLAYEMAVCENLLSLAKQMQAQTLAQIPQRASTLDIGSVMSMVPGGAA